MKSIFGDMFDFNRDGKIDLTEKAAELIYLDKLLSEEDEDCENFEDCEDDEDNEDYF